MLNDHHEKLLNTFVEAYHEAGGPKITTAKLKRQWLLAALTQAVNLAGTIPQIYEMCKVKEFETIKSRRDERIVRNVDGKGTLRMYIAMIVLTVTVIKEWKLDTVLDEWIVEVCETLKMKPKHVKAV